MGQPRFAPAPPLLGVTNDFRPQREGYCTLNMARDYSAFRPPSSRRIKLWRYMDFPKFVALLNSEALFFSRTDLLGDSFEGSLPLSFVKARARRHKSMKPRPGMSPKNWSEFIHSIYENQRRWCYVNCWHMNEHESAAMWELYARSGSGIAIQTTFDRLAKCLPETVRVGKVQYLDYAVDVPKDRFSPFSIKRKSFEHEREVRAFISDAPENFYAGDNPETGKLVPVDLERLIERIHVSPKAEKWFEDVTRAVATRFGLTKDVCRSALEATPLF